jgi:hypothetical protein
LLHGVRFSKVVVNFVGQNLWDTVAQFHLAGYVLYRACYVALPKLPCSYRWEARLYSVSYKLRLIIL